MNAIVLFFFKCIIYFFTFIYSIGFCLWLGFHALMHPKRKFWRVKTRDKPPQCLLDPSWGNHGYLQLQDIRLHYVENGDSSKPLMLFIHGFPEFWYSWRYQLREFSKDHWAVAVDMRGYGDSDKPEKKSDYKMKILIEDIRQIVLALGREKFILVGHDWGGLLAWNFLDFHSDMVEKFVIMNCPYHKDWIKALILHPSQFIKSWYCFFFQMPYLPELALFMNDFKKFHIVYYKGKDNKNIFSPTVTDEDIEAFKYTFSKQKSLTHAVDYYRANCGELYIGKSPKRYPPGLMLFGEHDDYMIIDFLDMAKRSIGNLQTYVLKDANHFAQQDFPSKLNDVVRAFLEGRSLI